MKKIIKSIIQNKNKYFIGIILLFSFYWYSYRPYMVSKTCIHKAMDWVESINGDQSDERYYYWQCQAKYGL